MAKGTNFVIFYEMMNNMRPKLLGYLLATVGFAGMFLAGYIFVTGSGGRGHLVEVTSYLIIGAACFFAGINYIYEARVTFSPQQADYAQEFEEISPIQQQWRTVHITTSRSAVNGLGNLAQAASVTRGQES